MNLTQEEIDAAWEKRPEPTKESPPVFLKEINGVKFFISNYLE